MENFVKFGVKLNNEIKEKARNYVNEVMDQNTWLKEKFEAGEVKVYVMLKHTGHPKNTWKLFVIINEEKARYPRVSIKMGNRRASIAPSRKIFEFNLPEDVFPWIEFKGLNDPEINKYFEEA